jgi:hypothetical protein
MDILLLLVLCADLTRNIMQCCDTVNTVLFVTLRNVTGFPKSQTGKNKNKKMCPVDWN